MLRIKYSTEQIIHKLREADVLLAQGKNAVEVANTDELLQTLGLIKEAVNAGELDEAISSAADKLRSGFKK
jgi:hypothetical protein